MSVARTVMADDKRSDILSRSVGAASTGIDFGGRAGVSGGGVGGGVSMSGRASWLHDDAEPDDSNSKNRLEAWKRRVLLPPFDFRKRGLE